MKLRKSLLFLAITATSSAAFAESCDIEKNCGLSGGRGAIQDESLLQRRAGGLGGTPPLPQQGERELPLKEQSLWHLPDQPATAKHESFVLGYQDEMNSLLGEMSSGKRCVSSQVSLADVMPFRISIDGQPVNSRIAGTADLQRCVDVELAKSHLQVRYDNLSAQPRLNVAAAPRMASLGQTHHFRGYSNYMHWVERGEVRIYGKPSRWGLPQLLEIVELDPLLNGEWVPLDTHPDQLYYQLRVYDAQGRFDETAMLPLMLTRGHYEPDADETRADLLAVTGGNRLKRHRIPVAGGTVTVNGSGILPSYAVFVMGDPVPVDRQGNFAAAQIIPRGEHSVEVAVLDPEGKGRVYRRDLRLPERDWFTVAIADITIGQQNTTGPARLITGEDRYYDDKLYVDGRLAFYTKGKIDGKYTLTASIDTGEEPIESLFSNFNDKNPRAFLRRMDANRHWGTFGDDSTLVEDAPTHGKGYVRFEDGKSHIMWGNFEQQNRDTELAQIDRRLYGAQAGYRSDGFTAFGERRIEIDGFAAEPGTATAREEFLGTGGSLYFLRHQDISAGSESLRMEIRDKSSGLVLISQQLTYGIDYEIDSIQGRILLNRPLSAITGDDSIVRSGGSLSGNPTYLIASYEYSPGFRSLDDLAVGGRAAFWANDSVRIGVTGTRQEHFDQQQDLEGVDITLRHSDRTWLKLEAAQTNGHGINEQLSLDGGFGFSERPVTEGRASAGRMEASLGLDDAGINSEGQLTFYHENRGAGFSAPGRLSQDATRQSGMALTTPLSKSTDLTLRTDLTEQGAEVKDQSVELGVSHQVTEEWVVSGGYRSEDRKNTSSYSAGRRDDLALQLEYNPEEKSWTAHGFVQGTVQKDEGRLDNNRVGAGGSYRINDRARLMGEISDGDLGAGARAGVDYAASDRTNLYLNYHLDNNRTDQGIGSRMGQTVTGARSRWTDTTSVYAEQRYQHGSQQTGLIQGYGLDFAPDDRWSYGLSFDFGHLNTETDHEIRRRAVSGKVGYRNEGTRYAGALEYRNDRTADEDRTVWLTRNSLSYQLDPEWRMIGRLNMAIGDSSKGSFFDGNFVEASVGYAYRPILNDRWNTLVKYTFLSDLAPSEQRTVTGNYIEYSQRSHVLALDTIYDLTERWSLGGRYAYRIGEMRMSRDDSADWFSSKGQLIAVRVDWQVIHKWDLMAELRRRDEFTAKDSRTGALLGMYRHFGNHFKAGVGYNFSEFSDDLTDMNFRTQGWFVNLIGKY